MEKEIILNYVDEMTFLARQMANIQNKIMSVRMGGITICTNNQVLTPDDQANLLYQEWQTADQTLEKYKSELRGMPQDELKQVYVELMCEEETPLRNARLDNLAIILGKANENRMEI